MEFCFITKVGLFLGMDILLDNFIKSQIKEIIISSNYLDCFKYLKLFYLMYFAQ